MSGSGECSDGAVSVAAEVVSEHVRDEFDGLESGCGSVLQIGRVFDQEAIGSDSTHNTQEATLLTSIL